MLTAVISKKNQVTIPKKFRKKLKLDKNDQIVFIQRWDEIILKPLRNIFSLRGIIKEKQELDFDKTRSTVKERIAEKICRE